MQSLYVDMLRDAALEYYAISSIIGRLKLINLLDNVQSYFHRKNAFAYFVGAAVVAPPEPQITSNGVATV